MVTERLENLERIIQNLMTSYRFVSKFYVTSSIEILMLFVSVILRLQTLAVITGRQTEMLRAIAAEVR